MTTLMAHDDQVIKTLGIYWDTVTDDFKFKVNLLNIDTKHLTKRQVLSEISRIFDPHGWIAPIIAKCKMILENIWKLKIDWDQTLPEKITKEYDAIRQTLFSLQEMSIPRWVQNSDCLEYTLIGFCDASEKAYAANIYLHTWDGANSKTTLLLSKTRITPMKLPTIPRLELNSAKLLSTLMKNIDKHMEIQASKLYLSDSMIALYWIKKNPSEWKTYVANRVAAIQDNSNVAN